MHACMVLVGPMHGPMQCVHITHAGSIVAKVCVLQLSHNPEDES